MSNLILLVMSNLLQPAAVFLIWKQGSTCAEQYFYTQTEHKNMNTHAEAKPCTCSATHTLFMEAKLTSESVCLQKLALCVSGLENQNIRSAPYSRLGLEWGLRILSVFARREDVQCGARWPSSWREWSQHWGNVWRQLFSFHTFVNWYIAISNYVSSISAFHFFASFDFKISRTSTPLMIVLAFVGGRWCMEEGLGAAQTVQQIFCNIVKDCEILLNIVGAWKRD